MNQRPYRQKPAINPLYIVLLAGVVIGLYLGLKPTASQAPSQITAATEVRAIFLTVTPELYQSKPTGLPGRSPPTPPATPESGPVVGMLAPDFSLKTLDGKTDSLSAYKGKAILINFWASWCSPCKEEMPGLQAIYEKYRDQGLVILGVDLLAQDTLSDVQSFVKETRVTYPILFDESGDISGMGYALKGLPTSFLIGRDGKIKRIQIGALLPDKIQQYVNEILQ